VKLNLCRIIGHKWQDIYNLKDKVFIEISPKGTLYNAESTLRICERCGKIQTFDNIFNKWETANSFVVRNVHKKLETGEFYMYKNLNSINNLNELNKLRNRIKDFYKLSVEWDGYSAKPIPKAVIDNSLSLLTSIGFMLPEVYPTGRESIQFEFDLGDNSLEIEIFKKSFEISQFKNTELINTELYNISEKYIINKKIREFYEYKKY